MKVPHWINENKLELVIILAIIFITLFLRVYKIDGYMTFLGDEGRDAIIIKRTLTNFDLPMIGPPTSIGNMYLGPLYYYMMTIPMLIVWLNPLAAAVMVALIGTASVGLIYYLTRSWFGVKSAIVATVLYSLSSVNIIYSRSSWNPNPAPFFTLLAFLGFYQAKKTNNYKWLVLTGGAIAFAVQMHYLAIILIPIFVIFVMFEIFKKIYYKEKKNHLIFGILISATLFLFLMSPLVIFDIRHNFINYHAVTTFFGNRETTVNLNALNSLTRIWPIYSGNLIERYLTRNYFLITISTAILVVVIFLGFIFKSFKDKKIYWPYLAIFTWLWVGVLGLSLYKQTIYDHYLGFLNPSIFILLSSTVFLIERIRTRVLRFTLSGISLFFFITLVFIEISNSPLQFTPNNQLKKTQEIANFVINQSEKKPFNFALISEHNYDSAYQYFMDLYGHKPKTLPFDKTQQLFVVCEDKICKPVGHPKYEIAAFGWTKIEREKSFDGIKVFKLIHNPDQDK